MFLNTIWLGFESNELSCKTECLVYLKFNVISKWIQNGCAKTVCYWYLDCSVEGKLIKKC